MAEVRIQQRSFGAQRWRSIETVEADEAKARMAELQRLYPMCDHRIAKLAPRRRRPGREWF